MGKNVKILTTRGIVSISMTLSLIYLFVTDTTKHITEFITLYTMILHYMFDTGDADK